MALVHEKLYQADDFIHINLGDYLRDLSAHLFRSYKRYPNTIDINIDSEDIQLTIDTSIHLGLLINELVTNSLKHAFPEDRKGKIDISIKHKDEMIELRIKDNGVGLPRDFDMSNTESLGLQIVNSLITQVSGTIRYHANEGTEFLISFPLEKKN